MDRTLTIELNVDLCETAIEEAIRLSLCDGRNSILLVPPDVQVLAGRLAEKYHIKSVIVTDLLKADWWIYVSQCRTINSEGA